MKVRGKGGSRGSIHRIDRITAKIVTGMIVIIVHYYSLLSKVMLIYRYIYSLMKSAAAPIPVPTHMEVIPTRFPVRFSSGRRVAIWRAPVAPRG